MNHETLQKIRQECEKIERDPGHGQVLIQIMNGSIHVIKPTPTILLKKEEVKV